MPTPLVIPADQIVGDLARTLGLKPKPVPYRSARSPKFTKDHVRRHALVALGALANLTQEQRKRVLRFATEINNL